MASKILSLLSLLFLSQLASFAKAQETITVTDWVVPFAGPEDWQAAVGDTMVFTWTGGHNVFIHPTQSCDTTGAEFIGRFSGTEYTFTAEDAGTQIFFSCDIGQGAHCRFGQFLKVFVYDTTPAGGSGPVPEIPVTETPTIAPTDAPVVPPPTEATVEVAPVEEAPTDTMGDSSESMSGAASTNAVVSMAGLMGAALALVLL